jgi:hypothetical protein
MTDLNVSRLIESGPSVDRFLEHRHLFPFFLWNQHSPRKEDWGKCLDETRNNVTHTICGSHPSPREVGGTSVVYHGTS